MTVGTTRFDALVKAVLSEPVVKALAAQGFTRMVVQHGHSDWPGDSTAHGLHIEGYKLKPSLDEDMHEADAVISHGGDFRMHTHTLVSSTPLTHSLTLRRWLHL